MTSSLQSHCANPAGRDLAVGDIHGYFTRLAAALVRADFDPARDRLFSVGDLVDRGPECEAALDWLARPWFYAVRGNHEDYAIRWVRTGLVDPEIYARNGGGWFMALEPECQERFAAAFERLPIAREVETAAGLVGIVHADCPAESWRRMPGLLTRRAERDQCLWSRRRINERDTGGVADIRAVVVGHTPLAEPTVLGNVHHIDTGGWTSHGRFTLLDLATLEPL